MNYLLCTIFSSLILIVRLEDVNKEKIEWVCANDECSEPISTATITSQYFGGYSNIHLEKGKDVDVYRRPVSKSIKYWEVQVKDGLRGFVPFHLLKEKSIIVKKDKLKHVEKEKLEELKKKFNIFEEGKDRTVKKTQNSIDVKIPKEENVKPTPTPKHVTVEGTTFEADSFDDFVVPHSRDGGIIDGGAETAASSEDSQKQNEEINHSTLNNDVSLTHQQVPNSSESIEPNASDLEISPTENKEQTIKNDQSDSDFIPEASLQNTSSNQNQERDTLDSSENESQKLDTSIKEVPQMKESTENVTNEQLDEKNNSSLNASDIKPQKETTATQENHVEEPEQSTARPLSSAGTADTVGSNSTADVTEAPQILLEQNSSTAVGDINATDSVIETPATPQETSQYPKGINHLLGVLNIPQTSPKSETSMAADTVAVTQTPAIHLESSKPSTIPDTKETNPNNIVTETTPVTDTSTPLAHSTDPITANVTGTETPQQQLESQTPKPSELTDSKIIHPEEVKTLHINPTANNFKTADVSQSNANSASSTSQDTIEPPISRQESTNFQTPTTEPSQSYKSFNPMTESEALLSGSTIGKSPQSTEYQQMTKILIGNVSNTLDTSGDVSNSDPLQKLSSEPSPSQVEFENNAQENNESELKGEFSNPYESNLGENVPEPTTATDHASLLKENTQETVESKLLQGTGEAEEQNSDSDKIAESNLSGSDGRQDFYETNQNENDVLNHWFSPVISVMRSLKELFANSDIDGSSHEHSSPDSMIEDTIEDAAPNREYWDENTTPGTIQQEDGIFNGDCEKEDDCNKKVDFNVHESDGDSNHKTNIVESLLMDNGIYRLSTETIVMLVVTSIVVLIFSLGHYYIEKSRRDGDLVAKINTLEGELFLLKKEHSMLDDQLLKANENATTAETKITQKESVIAELEEELRKIKELELSLDDTISRQEKEIEMLMENGLEMHRLLSESMSDEERTQMLLANISELKESLTARLNEIVSLSEQLDTKKQEIQILQLDLKSASDKQLDLEQKLANAHTGIEDKVLQSTEPLKNQIIKLEQIVGEKTIQQTQLEAEVAKQKSRCELLTVRSEMAEKGLQEAHGVNSSEALSQWCDVAEIKVKFLNAEKRIAVLKEEIDAVLSAKQHVEDKLSRTLEEVALLNDKYELAEKEKIDALTKLQVLSNYFKEKETQLQEELGVKESQWLQKQSEDHTIYEQMRSLREENLSFKSQNDTLKKEIIEQEASFKKQIANEGQKAHENWVALRQAERRLKEVQMEAGLLRNRLTAIESNSNLLADDKLNPNGLEANGESPFPTAASPPFMMFPREFIPPPPLTHTTPTRPPPLGRISSPPLPVDFTPPPPLMPYEIFSPPSPPPPLLHKPQPRDGKREPKESISSNYSSESTTDKSIRRSKR